MKGDGYVTKDLTYAAIPFVGGGYVIVHNGKQIEFKKTLDAAIKYITTKHKKSLNPTVVKKTALSQIIKDQ
jgi:hypothetical protein